MKAHFCDLLFSQNTVPKNHFPSSITNSFLIAGKTIDDFLAVEVCVFLYNIFVQREQTLVTHYHSPVYYNMPYVVGFRRINETRKNVVIRRLIEIIEIDDDHVGAFPDFQ